jgi:hypothetical protein
MSAAATAAGYLYASGRLRGRNGRDNEHHDPHDDQKRDAKPVRVKVAVYAPEPAAESAPPAPKKTPKIQYRTRRWRPEPG